MSRYEQVADAYGEPATDRAINFQIGLFRIGRPQITIDSRSTLRKQVSCWGMIRC